MPNRKERRKNLSKLVLHSSKFTKDGFRKEKKGKVITFFLEGFASTVDKDYHGDSVDPMGIDLSRYLQNPVLLKQHDRQMESIIGRTTDINVIPGKGMYIKAEVILKETIKEHEILIHLLEQGLVSGFSIGFAIHSLDDVNYDEEQDVLKINKLELHEISLVDIPSNPSTVATMKSVCKSIYLNDPSKMPMSEELKKAAEEAKKDLSGSDAISVNVEEEAAAQAEPTKSSDEDEKSTEYEEDKSTEEEEEKKVDGEDEEEKSTADEDKEEDKEEEKKVEDKEDEEEKPVEEEKEAEVTETKEVSQEAQEGGNAEDSVGVSEQEKSVVVEEGAQKSTENVEGKVSDSYAEYTKTLKDLKETVVALKKTMEEKDSTIEGLKDANKESREIIGEMMEVNKTLIKENGELKSQVKEVSDNYREIGMLYKDEQKKSTPGGMLGSIMGRRG